MEKGSAKSPPGLKTPFKNAIVFQHGKGNKAGQETTSGSGPGKTERGS